MVTNSSKREKGHLGDHWCFLAEVTFELRSEGQMGVMEVKDLGARGAESFQAERAACAKALR